MAWLLGLAALLAASPLLMSLRWVAVVGVPQVRPMARTTLILPYAPPGDLGPLAAALAAQTLAPQHLILAVARAEDAPPLDFPHRLVIAGPARRRGQKCQNQLAALATLSGEEEVIVLLDADIRPQPWWLATLIEPICRGSHSIVGGYRWSIPEAGLAAQLVAWLDRSWALLPKPRLFGLAWGGSLALAPAALPLVRAALDRAVSDDLMLARAARRARLPMLARGAVLPASPLGAGAIGFWLRQLRMLRLHNAPMWWLQGLVSHAGLLLWAVALMGEPWLALALCAAGLLRALCQDRAARRVGLPDAPATRAWQCALSASPLPDLFAVACLWASAFGRRVTWRGRTYRIGRDGTAEVAPGQ